MSAGAEFGVRRGGYYAIESLRLEKGYRAFGRELTPNDNPVEAGLLFACKLGTDIDFLGRAAVEKARAERPAPQADRLHGRTRRRPCCGVVNWCCATGSSPGR